MTRDTSSLETWPSASLNSTSSDEKAKHVSCNFWRSETSFTQPASDNLKSWNCTAVLPRRTTRVISPDESRSLD